MLDPSLSPAASAPIQGRVALFPVPRPPAPVLKSSPQFPEITVSCGTNKILSSRQGACHGKQLRDSLQVVPGRGPGRGGGFEREVHGRPAGIRTYLLLCMGSALIMVVSELLFFKYEAKGLTDILRADPGRDRGPGHHRHRLSGGRGDPAL